MQYPIRRQQIGLGERGGLSAVFISGDLDSIVYIHFDGFGRNRREGTTRKVVGENPPR